MYAIHSLYLLALFVLAQTTLAVPLDRPTHQHIERDISEIDNRALLATLTQSVSFNTVTTTQTQSGLITQLCQVTLTPITNRNGQQVVQQDRVCRLQVDGNNRGNNNGNNGNGGNGNGNNENTSTSTSELSTSTSSSSTFTSTSTSLSTTETVNTFTSAAATTSAAAGTANPGVSVIGIGSVPATGTVGSSATFSTTSDQAAATSAPPAPPAVSVIGVGQVPATGGTAIEANGGTETLPVTVVTTLSDGSVSTSVTTPSAAAAQAEAASVPGRKLEVLPIGLGVFAGISVIALIVVGLVTYERTKYRKAFRQRKLAEAGANMGYGGMAERT